jgi:predicted ATP-grasp superfamily ATP-dependent carboligase
VDGGAERTVCALESLGRDGGGVLVPTNDHFLVLVSQHFERLAKFYAITVPPWSVLEPLIDKPACYRLAQAAGLRTPRFFLPESEAELERAVTALDFAAQRYILSVRQPKGLPADVQTGRLTRVAGEHVDTVRQACRDIAARTGQFPMIAEVVPGRSDRCVGVSMVVSRENVPVVAYCVRRLQLYTYAVDSGFIHPYELGANVYCESDRDDEAVEAATTLVRRAGFYGPITVEFRRDSRDGQLTLIKADPRVVRATSLSTALGQDVPTALYQTFTGGRHGAPVVYSEGIAWIWLSLYLETVWQNRHRISLARQFGLILRNVHRLRSFAYLSLADPMPAVVDPGRAAGCWWRAGRRAASRLRRAAT